MINWLHDDFARRGKGSVSKLPFDEVFIDRLESNNVRNTTVAEANGNIVKIGGNVSCLFVLDENG